VINPANLLVTIDEHPDTINDGFFVNRLDDYKWGNLPASYHNNAANFSFADGHSEIHKWRGCLTQPRVKAVYAVDGMYLNNAISGPVGDPDIHWLSSHGGTVTANSY